MVAVRTMVAVVAVSLAAGSTLGQLSSFDRFHVGEPALTSRPDFIFARVQFQSTRGRRNQGWAHDYPRAERNLLRILSELTAVHTEPAAHTIVSLESPEIMKYPVLYFSEPGTWGLTEAEATNFRDYLSRGGFAIFDDFDGAWDWEVLETNMASVLPGRHFELLEESDAVYQSFFSIADLDIITHPMGHAYPPAVLRHSRRCRTSPGRGELQQRHRRLLGVVRPRAGIPSICRTKATSSV